MDPQTPDSKNQIIIDGKYILKEKIGSGSFGQLYVAISKEDGSVVAVKMEKKTGNSVTTLTKEAKILTELKGEAGFSAIYGYGKDANYSYLALELLGYDLEKLFKTCNYRFSLKTTIMIFHQMLVRIEALHRKGYVHRDIKPENFCMSKNNIGDLYLIDFGLARSYKDIHGRHILCVEKKGLVGTARYASINSHIGLEQSRRDDLEAIGYTIIYFMKGKLPWQNLKATNKEEKYDMIANLKLTIPISVLCKDLPTEFATYLSYVRGLDFEEVPDYKYLKGLLISLLQKSGYEFDFDFDWIDAKHQRARKSQGHVLKVDSQRTIPTKALHTARHEHIAERKDSKKNEESKQTETTRHKDSGSFIMKESKGKIPSAYKLAQNGEKTNPEKKKQNNNLLQTLDFERPQGRKKSLLKGNTVSGVRQALKKGDPISSSSSSKNDSSSENSSKAINISKYRVEEEEIPIEITQLTSPSAKIEETRPLEAKTKNSYYTGGMNCLAAPGTARGEARKRTFLRTYSAKVLDCPIKNADKMESNNAKPPVRERFSVKVERTVEGGEENLNESSIGEMVDFNKMVSLIEAKRFTKNIKNF